MHNVRRRLIIDITEHTSFMVIVVALLRCAHYKRRISRRTLRVGNVPICTADYTCYFLMSFLILDVYACVARNGVRFYRKNQMNSETQMRLF